MDSATRKQRFFQKAAIAAPAVIDVIGRLLKDPEPEPDPEPKIPQAVWWIAGGGTALVIVLLLAQAKKKK